MLTHLRAPHGASFVAVVLVLAGLAASALADPPDPPDPGDYGDAPEGSLAYPASGVGGRFPTCYWGTPAGFIVHTVHAQLLQFGPRVDFELDGNEGVCPPPAYDRDESYYPFDGDAGLIAPDPYTILPGDVVGTLSGLPGHAMGPACDPVYLGPTFDILITSAIANEAYANVLIDWDQDGEWGGSSFCGSDQVEEWILKNILVPPGYSGPLSGLYPIPMRIGPNPGYVWTRFTLSERPVLGGWVGDGQFDLGETEDYLLKIDPPSTGAEYGDAPENAPAYPSAGIMGHFPTCIAGPAGYVRHSIAGTAYIGAAVDIEGDGNANVCPQPPYDEDECGSSGGDGGLITPGAYTVVGSVETTCPGSPGSSLGPVCQAAIWGSDIDISVTNNRASDSYFNVLMDWNRDGRWGGFAVGCLTRNVPEHVLRDFRIPSGFSGPLSMLAPPAFTIGGADYIWTRFTISDAPVGTGWSGEGTFGEGETEDYLLRADGVATSVEGDPSGGEARTSSWGAVKTRFQ